MAPHYLVMTATPIPRTLGMTLFGDLDFSTLRELPPGRQPVNTYLVEPDQEAKWWAFVREWPSFKSGLRDLISEAEFSEMRAHGPKIADEVAEVIAEVRRNTAAAAN